MAWNCSIAARALNERKGERKGDREKRGQIYIKCIGNMPNKRIERDGG